jgi:hypothetical protein
VQLSSTSSYFISLSRSNRQRPNLKRPLHSFTLIGLLFSSQRTPGSALWLFRAA